MKKILTKPEDIDQALSNPFPTLKDFIAYLGDNDDVYGYE